MTTVIIGNGVDAEFAAAASALTGRTVVVRPADLCRAGWSFDLDDPMSGSFVANGHPEPTANADFVLVTTTRFHPSEFAWFSDPDDQGYVASESNALLRAWLDALPTDRVVGRPMANHLAGAGWSRAVWQSVIEDLGIDVDLYRPRAPDDSFEWACWHQGLLRSSSTSFGGAVGRIAVATGSDYLWTEGDCSGASCRINVVSDYPTLDSRQERSILSELLSRTSSWTKANEREAS